MTDFYSTQKETIKKYQEEVDKYRKLEDKLRKDNKTDTEKVKYYEKAYRESKSEHDRKSYKRTIDILNAKRELRKEILNFEDTKNN